MENVALQFAPALIRSSTESVSPSSIAAMSAVTPLQPTALTSAPASIRRLRQSRWPFITAIISGVKYFESASLRSAPVLISSFIASISPIRAACRRLAFLDSLT
eukprot:Pompholyxophrys_punicea_v1_NODE_38_length_4733_cov_3.558572.p8 type:complete len:104 gc:universal NODE_38_length_4733_cov_3.558572:857-1168(+)